MSTSKTGKHGHAKVNFTGIDIFTKKKYKEIQGSTHPMLTFESKKSEWLVMDVDEEGKLSLMDEKGNTREDISLPSGDNLDEEEENVVKGVKDGMESGEKEVFVSILSALGQDKVMAFVLRDPDEGKK